jgi:hypothetical protein
VGCLRLNVWDLILIAAIQNANPLESFPQNRLISDLHFRHPQSIRSYAMSKAKDTKKETKKTAAKTPKEKKEAKKLKKDERTRQ